MKIFSLLLSFPVLLAAAQAQNATNPAPAAASQQVPLAASADNGNAVPPAPASNEPVPYPQQQSTNAVAKAEAKPKEPPKKFGDCSGEYWIGQRVVSERHAGWGWIKKDGDGWSSAKWCMLQETPRKSPAPGRFYSSPNADDDVQYKLYGIFSEDKGYEPNIDAYVSVFIIKGFEVIGPAEPIKRKLPGPTSSRPGRISERDPSSQRALSDE